ncbi:UDP-N-acetylglucosamine 2-epimerase (non-hydrolyzing) [Candidatus Bathyarchaeota archaeon]|nr:MAG: UDP-N-acetylglucosamine 2-epimerase (non-hydrolyzing) [Candidatus Bathyarchaeota archaeon]
MKVSVILGTRPEIIKFSPIICEFERLGLDYFILHSGQHYSYNLDRVFFEQLGLPEAKYNLDVGSGSHGLQTGRMLIGIEDVLRRERPDVALVQGDTNTALAGALAAVKLRISVGHVEAGLRSYDRSMPEEINRLLADHCSDLLFAPTVKAKQILLGEGIPESRVYVTGNTVVDALYRNLRLAEKRSEVLNSLGLEKRKFFLVTVHRQENVDDKERFSKILEGLELVHERFGFPIVYPVHPRAAKRMREFNLKPKGLRLIDPLDYLSFLLLESCARLVLTDSGGVQEETCILRVPCVTLRYNTERPETLEIGSNILAGAEPEVIVEKTEFMLKRRRDWPNPFGDGKAGIRITKILIDEFGETR